MNGTGAGFGGGDNGESKVSPFVFWPMAAGIFVIVGGIFAVAYHFGSDANLGLYLAMGAFGAFMSKSISPCTFEFTSLKRRAKIALPVVVVVVLGLASGVICLYTDSWITAVGYPLGLIIGVGLSYVIQRLVFDRFTQRNCQASLPAGSGSSEPERSDHQQG